MFRADLLFVIRSLKIVYAAIGICYASYVGCLLATADNDLIIVTNTYCCGYSFDLVMDSRSVRNM